MLQHDPLLAELGLAPLWVSRARAVVPAAIAPAERTPDEAFRPAAAAVAEPMAEPSKGKSIEARRDAPPDATPSDTKPSAARLAATSPPVEPSSKRSDVGSPDREALTMRSDAAPSDDIPFDAYDASDGFAGYESAAFERVDFVPPVDFDAPAQPSLATLDFGALRERVASCTACGLCEKRTQTVFGVGDEEADWMIIGEAPGENEDRLGEPFVGQAGKLLDNMLRAVMLNRTQNVYIANVIKCRPPGNRNPHPDEVARCEPYLKRQVALVRPKLILALGKFAAQTLLKSDASVSSMRGRVHHYEGVPVIVSYHPAYLLRSLPEKSKAWADLCLAQATFLKAAT
jgi:uracil-DNA glycosylase family 4